MSTGRSRPSTTQAGITSVGLSHGPSPSTSVLATNTVQPWSRSKPKESSRVPQGGVGACLGGGVKANEADAAEGEKATVPSDHEPIPVVGVTDESQPHLPRGA